MTNTLQFAYLICDKNGCTSDHLFKGKKIHWEIYSIDHNQGKNLWYTGLMYKVHTYTKSHHTQIQSVSKMCKIINVLLLILILFTDILMKNFLKKYTIQLFEINLSLEHNFTFP